jgi:hypothetical protein
MRRSRKGGFFFKSKTVDSEECNVNNLADLERDDGTDTATKMRQNYQKCCPKGMFGRKNRSPYCKQLEKNFNAVSTYNRDVSGYYGDETDVSKIKKIMNTGGSKLGIFSGGRTKRRRTKNRKTKRRKYRR